MTNRLRFSVLLLIAGLATGCNQGGSGGEEQAVQPVVGATPTADVNATGTPTDVANAEPEEASQRPPSAPPTAPPGKGQGAKAAPPRPPPPPGRGNPPPSDGSRAGARSTGGGSRQPRLSASVQLPEETMLGTAAVPAGTYEIRLTAGPNGHEIALLQAGQAVAREDGITAVEKARGNASGAWVRLDERDERLYRIYAQEAGQLYFIALPASRQ